MPVASTAVMADFNHREIISAVIKYSLMTGITYYAVTWLLNNMEPRNKAQRRDAKKKASSKLEILGRNKIKLTEYELLMASNLIVPSDISVSWKNIAGLEDVLRELQGTVILPIKKRKFLKSSKLARPPTGVLLHGPPGCGKTLIAKATAREASAAFINLDISMLTDKWYGESQKLVSALFSLAEKLEPCIIFIDEIDSILRTRSSHDHEATAMMKAQFLLLWDGLCSDSEKTIIVMGATNRPQEIDPAIRRRMPAIFSIPLPDYEQRREILKLILSEEVTDEIDYDLLALKTVGFSGSLLKELCRSASLYRMREYAQCVKSDSDDDETSSADLRHLNMGDMLLALNSLLPKM